MRKYFFLLAALLFAGHAMAQCNYSMNKTDTVTGDIIRSVSNKLIETGPEGEYKLTLSLIKEKGVGTKYLTAIYNFDIAGRNASNHYPERCIAPGETKIVFLLKNGVMVEVPYYKVKKECSVIMLMIMFKFSEANITNLKESPVTDFTVYYTGKLSENIKVSPANSTYFMETLHCVE